MNVKNIGKVITCLTAFGGIVYGALTKAELYPEVPKADPDKKHILCIGDSLTYGARFQFKRDPYSYPACLNKLIHEKHSDWEVLNFGLSGRTVDINGDFPYMKEKLFKESLKVPADIIVIMFGGNDSKHVNVIGSISSIINSYKNLVSIYREANPKAKIICMVPYHPLRYNYDMSEIGTGKVREAEIEEFICDGLTHLDLEDVAWKNPDEFFSKDGVHPTREGCYRIALELFDKEIEKRLYYL